MYRDHGGPARLPDGLIEWHGDSDRVRVPVRTARIVRSPADALQVVHPRTHAEEFVRGVEPVDVLDRVGDVPDVPAVLLIAATADLQPLGSAEAQGEIGDD